MASATITTNPIPSTNSRRGFLSALAALPLIGGGVTLIGNPTAVAERPSLNLLEAYKTWPAFEQNFLCWEMAGDPMAQRRYRGEYAILDDKERIALAKTILGHRYFVGDVDNYHMDGNERPSKRAALVLSTVGCDWREAV